MNRKENEFTGILSEVDDDVGGDDDEETCWDFPRGKFFGWNKTSFTFEHKWKPCKWQRVTMRIIVNVINKIERDNIIFSVEFFGKISFLKLFSIGIGIESILLLENVKL